MNVSATATGPNPLGDNRIIINYEVNILNDYLTRCNEPSARRKENNNLAVKMIPMEKK